MSVSPTFKAFVLEQLSVAGPVAARSMVGGVGPYRQGLSYALIDDDTLYLKVDTARPDFERIGSEPFRPYGGDSHLMQYYALPAERLEHRSALRRRGIRTGMLDGQVGVVDDSVNNFVHNVHERKFVNPRTLRKCNEILLHICTSCQKLVTVERESQPPFLLERPCRPHRARSSSTSPP